MIALAEWAPDCYRDLDGNYVLPKLELAIMHGATVGLSPIVAVQSIALFDGLPTIRSDGALALVERSGLLEDMHEEFVVDEAMGLTAISTMRRRHQSTPITSRFSTAMADQAGLSQKEGPWRSYPQRCLMMRARSWTLRDGFADVLRGLHIREEVEDYVAGPAGRSLVSSSSVLPVLSSRVTPAAASVAGRDRPRYHAVSPGSDGANTPAVGRATIVTADADEPNGCTAPAEALGEPEAGVSETVYTLIDAEGAFVEVSGGAELRDAFDRLLLAPELAPDQVIGLWESNEGARVAIEDLFGGETLAEVAERVRIARQKRRPAKRAKPGGRPVALRRGMRDSELVKPVLLALEPHGSIDELFARYLDRLRALQNDDAGTATTLAAFREANHSIEARLRAGLPHLINKIDTIYAWAAKHAR